MADTPTPFQMSRISIQGGIGAGLLIAVLIGSMLAELPILRGPTLAALVGGVILAAALIAWHRRRPLESRELPLSLGLDEGHRRRR
jgi:ABC-type cobalamin transport system permease subunit